MILQVHLCRKSHFVKFSKYTPLEKNHYNHGVFIWPLIGVNACVHCQAPSRPSEVARNEVGRLGRSLMCGQGWFNHLVSQKYFKEYHAFHGLLYTCIYCDCTYLLFMYVSNGKYIRLHVCTCTYVDVVDVYG